MINILYFDWHSEASEFYRSMPLDYIKHKDFTITRSTEREIRSHTINFYDVIIILRPSSDAHLNIMNVAKDLGKKLIIDWDDDPLHLPNTNPMYGYYEGNKQRAIKCLALADEIWVSTEGVKKSFRLYNKNIHIIPNAYNDFIFKHTPKFTYNKIAMFRGGGSHVGDIYYPGTVEWIVKMMNTNKTWKWYWFGQDYEYIKYRHKHNNYYHNPGGSTVQFYKSMHEANASIFYYPLADNSFNRSKSNCSWIESVSSGSAYFGMSEFPEFQKPGIMPLKEMADLMKMPDVLEKMHKESWEYIQDNLLLSKVNETRLQRLLNYVK